jgi:hypothetical protein
VVVEGTITQVEFKAVTAEEFGESHVTDVEPWVAILHLSEMQVLRGADRPDPLYAELVVDWRTIVGRHAVLCAYWSPRLNRYLVRRADAVFTLVDTLWVRMKPQEEWSDSEFRSKLGDVQPQAIADRAEFVVTGTILSLEDSTVVVDGQKRGKVKKVTMELTAKEKGDLASRRVRFLAYGWLAYVPAIGVGEHWMAFLEKKGSELWVVAGANGLLRVGDNDKLLYDGVAPYRLTRSQLTRLLRDEAHDDK